jgi:PAS domain S-box-containing protein
MAGTEDGSLIRKPKTILWALLLVFMSLTSSIAVLSKIYYNSEKQKILHQYTINLQAVADLKADQIDRWRRRLLDDGILIFFDHSMTDQLLAFLDRPSPALEKTTREWLSDRCRILHYVNIVLVDRDGAVRLTAKENEYHVKKYLSPSLGESRRKQQVTLTDLVQSIRPPRIHLETIVPLMPGIAGKTNEVGGFLVLFTDPADFLYPMLKSLPIPSASGETLLVRREGNNVLFLNELRHRKDTALKLRLPLSTPTLPAASVILGHSGVIAGRDYRGVSVWSVARPVEGSSWFIVAKIDLNEIELPVRRAALAIFLVTLFLILATALVVLFLWQRQNSRFRLDQLEAESRRRALVSHFDYLTRYANDIILLTDEKANILEANERAILTYGYGREGLLKLNLRDIRVPEERGKLSAQYEQLEASLGMIFETQHEKRDGSLFPVEVSARVIEVQGKKYYQSIVRDISERKRAEEEIMSAKAFLEMVVDMSPFSMWISDKAGTVTKVNRSLCATIHLTEKDIVGKYNALKDENLEKRGVLPMVRAVFEKHKPARFSIPWMAADAGDVDFKKARDMHIDVSMFPILNPQGELTNVVCQWIDITERKRAEAALRESEERFRGLYENATIGIYRTTVAGRILLANPALVHMLGYATVEELARRNLEDEDFYVGSTRADFLNQIERDGQLTGRESAWKRLDGSTIFVRESARATRDENGKILFIDGTVEDVSAKHEAEEEIHRLNQELEQRVLQRTAQLQAANKELEAFSYSVSHDLRAPLRAITGFSQILTEEKSGNLDAEGRRLLGVITDNTRRMGQLIDDLLAFSRLTRQALAPAKVDFASLARDLFAELRSQEKGRKIAFTVGELPAAEGDTAMLRQLLHNLLANALKFTRPRAKPRIELAGRAGKGENVYWVKDNGVGFDMQYADKLFGVFQRLHGSAEFEGTGVGLAIVQRIAARHGGRVWAEGEVGKGATFYFALPNQGGTHD